ncbi:MAG: hypothetical protein LBO79_04700 [Zoogloeaceae bacterium]|jgi:general secretion pathway protein D|nr:hypothetical protein [Zoogloeaceae bacterium]
MNRKPGQTPCFFLLAGALLLPALPRLSITDALAAPKAVLLADASGVDERLFPPLARPAEEKPKKAETRETGDKAKETPKAGAKAKTPGDFYLRQITLDEAAQLISQISRASIVVTSSVSRKVVSLYLRDVSVDGMVKNLCRAAGVWYRFDAQTNTYLIMSAAEYQQDIAITRDDVTRTYVLKHHNVVSIANAIQALFGERVELIEPVEEMAPTDLGGTSRTQGGSSGNSSGNASYGGSSYGGGNRSYSGSNRSSTSREGVTRRSSGGSGSQQSDPRRELNQISQTGLEASLSASEDEQAASQTGGGRPDSSRTENISAAEVMRAVSRQGAPIHLTYNLLHNLLLVRTGDEVALKDIETLIQEMDRPPRQVLLEMKIMEVELGNDFHSIFDIGLSGKGASGGPLELGVGSASGVLPDGTYPRNVTSFGNFALESSTFAWQFVSDRLRARLQLLEAENRVNVLATPMVVAANNQIARLFIGNEQTLVTGASADTVTGTTGATSNFINVNTELRNVGQTLVILPRINADRSVTLTIDQDNSRILPNSTTLPMALPDGTVYRFPIDTVNTANLQVTAHARDGLTVAVGGMISQRVADGEDKVPLLGDMPVLGNLFKRTVKENSRSQIVLLITPWVLESPEESDALARKKENEARELHGARRPHTGIFEEAPAQGYSSPLLDILNPAPKKP